VLDITTHDAVGLAALLRAGHLSAQAAVAAAISRIERLNPLLNAVVTPLFDRAAEKARRLDAEQAAGRIAGPLHGVPVLVKDLFDAQRGVRNTFGCPAFSEFVAGDTSTHIARLEAAGAVIVGRTNTPEFGHQGITDNRLFGATSTPFDLARNAGGSSGGSAAAVAAGMVPLAQGSDAGGSVRIPAAWCGVVGFKPSYGRVPLTGGPNAFGTQTPFVHVGPLARTVRDAALMTQVLSGPHPRDPLASADDRLDWLAACEQGIAGRRVAFSPDFGVFAVEPAVAAVVQSAVESLQSAGAIVEQPTLELPASQQEMAELWRRQVGVFYAELFAAFASGGLALSDDDLCDAVREMTEYGRKASALDERRDQWLRTRIFHALQDTLDEYDLLVTPTLACSPPLNLPDGQTRVPETVCGKPTERCIGWCLTHPVNFTGHPAASVPAGLTADGLPVGMQIIGRRYDDGLVLAACRAVEIHRPWLPALAAVQQQLDAITAPG
jgi:Asp-tRNA(Asn)/Glu-tRNA(Gln) amidotransferase A subunit family amidase